jgi:hypothetical protein
MKTVVRRRIAAAVVAAAGTGALSLLGVAPASASDSGLFSFATYRRTAEMAVSEAVGMAEEAAREAGFAGECTVVRVVVTEIPNDPYRGHIFNASATVSCLR